MFVLAAVAAWSLAAAHAQAPKISMLPIPAIAGETLQFQIEASNSPDSYDATPVAPNASVQVSVGATGLVTIVLGADLQPQEFDVNISATNEDGTDTQKLTIQIQAADDKGGTDNTGGPVENTSTSAGLPRVFQGKLSVKPPRSKAGVMISAVNLTGVLITQGELVEDEQKGTTSQLLVTNRISNKAVLQLMIDQLEDNKTDGYSLSVVSTDGGEELVASKKTGEPIPVPTSVFAYQAGDGLAGYKQKASGSTVRTTSELYVPISAEWRNDAAGTNQISLTGIAKTAFRSTYNMETEEGSSQVSGLNVNLSGYNAGAPAP
jgi:hypothetical protein